MIPKSLLQRLFALLPLILEGVVEVERAVKAPGQAKKEIVLGTITAAAKAGEQIPIPIVQGVSALIDSIVGTLNAAGVFSHGAQAAVASPAAEPIPAPAG